MVKKKAEMGHGGRSGKKGHFSFKHGKVREELNEKEGASQQRQEVAANKTVSHADFGEKRIPNQGEHKSPGARGACQSVC